MLVNAMLQKVFAVNGSEDNQNNIIWNFAVFYLIRDIEIFCANWINEKKTE